MAMLKSGVVSDQSNDNAASALDDMIQYMQTDEYRKKREKEMEVKPPKEVGPYIQGAEPAVPIVATEEQDRNTTIEATVQDDDDAELADLRAQRLARLKAQAEKDKQFRSRGHGMYRDVTEKDFLPEVTSTGFVAVHFYHPKFARCKVMDDKIGLITPRQVAVKFLRCNAEEAPFFCEKLSVKMLPCVIMFKDGVAVDRILGFDGLCRHDGDDFPAGALEKKICSVFKLEVTSAAYDEDEED